MSATMITRPTLSSQTPVEVFAGRFNRSDTAGTPGYGVAPDGRLLIVQPVEPDPPINEVNFVTNWFDEVRRLTRGGRP